MVNSTASDCGPRTSTDEPLGLLMIKASARVRKVYARALGGLGLTLREYSILLALRQFGPSNQRILAGRVDVDPSELVACLDRLTHAGRVRRSRDALDRRRHIVSITRIGLATIDLTDSRLADVNASMFGDEHVAEQLHRGLFAFLESGDASGLY